MRVSKHGESLVALFSFSYLLCRNLYIIILTTEKGVIFMSTIKPEDFLRTSKVTKGIAPVSNPAADNLANAVGVMEAMGYGKKDTNVQTFTESSNLSDSERNDLIDEMVEHAERFIRAAKALKEGRPIIEAYDEIFLEDADREVKLASKVRRMIEHILKLAYCEGIGFQNNKVTWTNQFNNPKQEAQDILAKKKTREKYLRNLNANLQEVYEEGIEFYEDAMEEYPDLRAGRKLIPDTCPWTAEELMKRSINGLIQKLPGYKNQL